MKSLASLAFAAVASAQSDLPKDVIQLSQIRRDVAKSVAMLENYTCTETIDRAIRRNIRSEFRHSDTVTLEVAVVKDRELYAKPGVQGFVDLDLRTMGAGLISTGGFATAIRNVFTNNVSTIRYHGAEDVAGRNALRWDYTVPYNLSGWVVRLEDQSGRVSETGSFWVDAQTLDLLRLAISAQDIPANLDANNITETLDYARVRVRSRDLLLPKTVETSVVKMNGAESRNRMEFSRCHAFEVNTELKFPAADERE